MNKDQENLAEIAVKIGVNLQPDQFLMINSPIETAEFAREIAKKAYEAGAGEVYINYTDPLFSKLHYEQTALERLEKVPDWYVERLNYLQSENGAVISIHAQDPNLLKGVDSKKIAASNRAINKASENYQEALMKNDLRWCVISVPTEQWAKSVFADKTNEEAMKSLWNSILKSTHCDADNPVSMWREKDKKLKERSKWLNDRQFAALHYKNNLGTDLTVGLPKNHVWEGGSEKSSDEVSFFPNLPTEEIFSAPDKTKVNGTVYSSFPLVLHGVVIEGIKFVFKDGRVVDYDAKTNKNALDELFESENADYLGEVALVPQNSPIAEMGTLFYNTLFDENASCHLALGDSYPSSVKNGTKMSKEELENAGLNSSYEHVDFMIGTDDLTVTGIDEKGNETPIIIDGKFCI